LITVGDGGDIGSVRIRTRPVGVWRRRLKRMHSRLRRREREQNSLKTRCVTCITVLATVAEFERARAV